ncbi:MAG: hypothetical protein ACOCZW_04155, partial [Bacteroidota bacterium]
MKRILTIVLIAWFAALPLIAQQGGSKQNEQQETPQPLELPNFVIEGVERLNVKSGIKQMPDNPRPLSDKELDSLNSLDKQQVALLPPKKLPETTIKTGYSQGFFSAELGRYTTPVLSGGYGLNMEGYELYAKGNIEGSSGHVEGSEYTDFGVDLTSDYIAPDKFWIFGGSRTRTKLDINNSTYNLYALENMPNRRLFNLDFGLDVDGSHNDVIFQTGGGVSTSQLSQQERNAFDNNINGYLGLKKYLKNFYVGADLSLDFHSVKSDAVNFIQLDGFIAWNSDNITLEGNGGFQFANSSAGTDRGGFLISGKLEYRVNRFFSFRSTARSGLDNITFAEMLERNPYMDINSMIDFPYDIVNIKNRLFYHPKEDFGLSAGLDYRLTNRYPYFSGIDSSIILGYDKANVASIVAEAFWTPAANGFLVFNFTANTGKLDKADTDIPYLEPYKFSANYSVNWWNDFGTNFGISYIAERNASSVNNEKIQSYINLSARAHYKIDKNLSAYLYLDNLLNSDIEIWHNYKE